MSQIYEVTVFKLHVTSNNTARGRLLLRERELFMYFSVHFLADICKNYQNLTDAERKYDYVTVNPKCDDSLNGWYRFQGAAGTKVVTTCPPQYRCDADFPAWLSGDHPTVAEGTVTRKVCIHMFGACCDQSVFIQVKNCGSYYIYKLDSPGTCNTRYCSTD